MAATARIIPRAVTAVQLIADVSAVLANAGVGTARLDAEVLLAAACGMDRTTLYRCAQEPVASHDQDTLRTLVTRRCAREPLQYIVGRQEFWSLDIAVTPDVLIPRPETERLVELALERLRPRRAPRICDLGTGSGCIALALARELPNAEIYALDISPAALVVARNNARRLGVAARIAFAASDCFAAVAAVRFDAIVCNPPYLSSADLSRLQPELAWEPRRALAGGAAGLDVIQPVLARGPEFLVEAGWLLMEIGAAQAAAVSGLARAAQFSDVSVIPDYAGLPRVLLARR